MAPIFVGSNDDNSRVRSNRVGFAISTSNPGSASEGDAYYNSTDNQLNIYDGSAWASAGAGGNSVELVASGTLSDGQTVIIQSDGTVTGIGSTAISQSVGTAVTFESGNTKMYYQGQNMIYDSANENIVIFYDATFIEFFIFFFHVLLALKNSADKEHFLFAQLSSFLVRVRIKNSAKRKCFCCEKAIFGEKTI